MVPNTLIRYTMLHSLCDKVLSMLNVACRLSSSLRGLGSHMCSHGRRHSHSNSR